jgi:hypothetical protein
MGQRPVRFMTVLAVSQAGMVERNSLPGISGKVAVGTLTLVMVGRGSEGVAAETIGEAAVVE